MEPITRITVSTFVAMAVFCITYTYTTLKDYPAPSRLSMATSAVFSALIAIGI
jgi:hypothetical protein